MTSPPVDPSEPMYVLGHSDRELERLKVQATFYEDITRRFFTAAGIGPGMHVLDVGCGVGDVSLLVAALVGREGSVMGVDRVAEPLALARARASASGLGNVTFRESTIADLAVDRPFDAVVGRFILMHQRDPVRALRDAAAQVRTGGIVVMIESQMDACIPGVHSHPTSPLQDRAMRYMIETIRAAGAHTDMGLRLRETFVAAGLPEPELRLEARVEGGPHALIYRHVAESARSVLPVARQFDVRAWTDQELDELESRLREEVVASGGVLTSPPVVGAWVSALPRG